MAEEHAPEFQAAPGSDVFVSYASQDASVANAIVKALERRGVTCWIAPRDVQAGAQYAEAIVRAIGNAQAFVLVLSVNATASSHVGREVERAASKHRRILALRIDAAPLTPALEYFLSESQWVEAQSGNLEPAYTRLIEAIRAPAPLMSANAPPAIHGASGVGASSIRLKSHRARIVLVAGLGVLALAMTALWADRSGLTKHATTEHVAVANKVPPVVAAVPNKSIAVLPFVDMSEKHDQEYFSDGLSEELIDHLAHIQDLKVIARTSSFAFKGKNEDMRSIATKLGVANLLEGSVRKSAGTLRITAQLIRASDGVHLWSEIYDRKLTEIFKVQDEISTTVAKALSAALNMTPATGVPSASKQTTNVEAYNLLLQGNYFFDRGDKDDDFKAVTLYQQVLKVDPHYAIAWAQLARVYAWQGYAGELVSAEAEVKGRAAAEHALAIDPSLSVGFYARGNVSRLVAGDWVAATADYERAAAIDPQGEVGRSAYGNILILKAAMSGQLDDVIKWNQHSLEQNPLGTGFLFDLAWYQQSAGSLEQAARTCLRLLELNPDYATGPSLYAMTLLLLGKHAEALMAAQKESDVASRLMAQSSIYWAMGQRAESDRALRALEQRFADRNAYQIATAHANRGEADAAFAWLNRTNLQAKGMLQDLKIDSSFRKLRGDPRFDAFLRKVRLTE